ncbi:MAG: 4a-hydroxytetrahydrobiopterin dehydratase [Xanthomonadales bacterium]|nr:4a-hydroxytetrahydrobiopterin dehydratase [Xanthomonadales bacterium]
MTTLAELAALRCRPLRGADHKAASTRVEEALTALPGWSLVEDGAALSKTYSFTDYYRTLAFVNALAFIAHAEDHHPDLSVHYNRCVVRYSTHDVGGLSENDLICAAKTELLLGAH